jgi:hypothetical protein
MESNQIMNRFYKLLIWVAIFWFSTGCCALAAKSSANRAKETSPKAPAAAEAPTINVPEVTYDFGEVTEGAEVTHDFLVKNTGSGNLEIQQVRPG